LLAGVPIGDVSKLLGHASVKVTEDYSGHWVTERLILLRKVAVEALKRQGASFAA